LNQLFSSAVQNFIDEHALDDIHQLLLKYKAIDTVPISVIVDQIVGRRKAREKFKSWSEQKQLIYPPSINLEQSSSEQTARNKVAMLSKEMALDTSLLDLTGGFGIDSYFFSRSLREVHFVEPNGDLLKIAQHNHAQLGVNNIQYHNSTAEEFLESSDRKFDVVYIDPSRRPKNSQKVFSLNQCVPDVVLIQEKIWQITDRLLVKAAPLLDIEKALKDLKHVKKVSVVSVHNECKELLFYCEKPFESEPLIEAKNLTETEFAFSFKISDERKLEVKYSDPLQFFYEPNASLLKSGAFKTIASRFKINKLHPSTHFYTSEHRIDFFPGRVFKIESHVKPHDKMRTFFPDGKANIITRNYPLTVQDLRKKTGLKEGGERYLIGCSGMSKKFLLVAVKLDSL
jgi:16S rRNA G966 N2-methylase RsmD